MISEFKDEHFFLSNFFICSVTYNGATYSNNEACFQAQKTLDIEQRKQFESLDPLEARELGKKITIRPDHWYSSKYLSGVHGFSNASGWSCAFTRLG